MKEVDEDAASEAAEVTGHDQVIVLRAKPCVLEMRFERGKRRRRHGSAHVARVLDAVVLDPADGGAVDERAAALRADDAAAGAGDRPLRGGRPLTAVAKRKTVLPLGGCKVRGGQCGRALCVARVDGGSGKRQPLCHGRARAVQTEKRDLCAAHGEGGADALVEQVACKQHVQLAAAGRGLLPRSIERQLLKARLSLLPRFLPEARVRLGAVEV